jgi:adenosylcobinamide-phosphate synthase
VTSFAVGAVGLALVLDRAIGEPRERWHPVVALGRVIDRVDRDWRRPALAGGIVATVVPAMFGLAGAAVVAGGSAIDPILGAAMAGVVLFTTVSLRSLESAGERVIQAVGHDAGAAAKETRALVGRETATLGPGTLRSAAVESLAENLADGLVGPLLAFALGSLVSLPVAAGAAAWVKAVNTLDSMLGYRDHPMGWASARLDDLVAWLPARASAALLAIAGGHPGAIRDARTWAKAPSSPNSGWPMAALAAVLDVTLVKPGAYVLRPGNDLPTEAESREGVRVVRHAGLLAFGLTGVFVWF